MQFHLLFFEAPARGAAADAARPVPRRPPLLGRAPTAKRSGQRSHRGSERRLSGQAFE